MALKPPQSLPNLQTRSLSPTSSSTSSRASSRARPIKPGNVPDIRSDEATVNFVKRVLRPNVAQNASATSSQASGVQELLPPLTSSNEVDLQLYAFIALIIQECVQVWYARFTPDQSFVDEVVQIIAHCTRAIEERARKTNLEELLLDDLPNLLDAHIFAYRTATRSTAPDSGIDSETVYHALRPHYALDHESGAKTNPLDQDPDGNFRTYRHLLAQGLLAVLLPPGDLQNACLRALVSEVSADLMIGNFIGNRFSQNSFIYDTVRRAADIIQTRLDHERWAVDEDDQPKDRLSQFGLLSKGALRNTSDHDTHTVSDVLLLWFQYCLIAISGLRALISALVSAPSLPRRKGHGSATSPTASPLTPSSADGMSSPHADHRRTKPILQYQAWTAMKRVACFESRMPWAAGILALLHQSFLQRTPGLGEIDGTIDRLLAHHTLRHIFPLSKHLPTILLNLRLALFPGNAFPSDLSASSGTSATPGSSIDPSANRPPTPEEKATTTARSKRAAAFALLNCIPRPLARMYLSKPKNSPSTQGLGAEETTQATEHAEIEAMIADISATVLDPFSNEYMNRHLVLAVLERVIVALVPELGREREREGEAGVGKRVAELLAERGVDVDGEGDSGDEGEGGGDGERGGVGYRQGEGKRDRGRTVVEADYRRKKRS